MPGTGQSACNRPQSRQVEQAEIGGPGIAFPGCSRSQCVIRPGLGLGAHVAAVISSPLWGVSDVALRALKLRHGHVILSSVYDAPESCVTHVTCVYPLIAAAFEFLAAHITSRQRHVSHAKTPLHRAFSQMDL